MGNHLFASASLLLAAGYGLAALPSGHAGERSPAHPEQPTSLVADRSFLACAASDTVEGGPGYYWIELRRPASSPGPRDAGGRVEVSYPASPFGLPLDRDGRLVQRLRFVLDEDFRSDGSRGSRLVAWVASPELDPVRKLGEIGPDGTASGKVALNKYLVFVTEEPRGVGEAERWEGPVVLKGKSRSGRMQSMASHGMFEREPC